MEIYLVRHGETGGNVAHRHQAEHTPLSYVGTNQAKQVAEKLCEYEPTHLISSNLVRALETARVIGETCDLVPETSELFIELKRPHFLYGWKHRSPASMWFYFRWYLGWTNGEGETYAELRQRIEEAKRHLATLPNDSRVVVVTHSVFMSLFVEHMCREHAITPWMAVRTFLWILRMKNTHVEPLLFDGESDKKVCAWILNK